MKPLINKNNLGSPLQQVTDDIHLGGKFKTQTKVPLITVLAVLDAT